MLVMHQSRLYNHLVYCRHCFINDSSVLNSHFINTLLFDQIVYAKADLGVPALSLKVPIALVYFFPIFTAHSLAASAFHYYFVIPAASALQELRHIYFPSIEPVSRAWYIFIPQVVHCCNFILPVRGQLKPRV